MSKQPKKPAKGKSLADLNPELAKQWHPTKNGQLSPYDVSPGSTIKAWWKCPKGDDHEWSAVIADRNKGIGCAVCSNYKVVKSNCLQTLNPELAKEWHPTKNGTLTPRDVHPGSATRVWWKCPKGDDHVWRTVLYSRTGGKGCPICSGRKVVKSTCLETLNPQLAKEWHPTKNSQLAPSDVSPNSSKSVWWKCQEGDDHVWKAAIRNRNSGLGCPICSNQKIVKSNCLATLNPELAMQWHYEKNGKLTPTDVGVGSGKAVWWKCPEGEDHVWRAELKTRNKGRGCPICIGRKVVASNSFAALYPVLAKQWHPEKNGILTPNDVRPGSNKKVWWQCIKYMEHVWRTSVNDRTSGTSCPKCNPATSAPELRIYCELGTIFPLTEHRKIIKGFEVDIYIPELNFGIEYDGSYWHKNTVQRDKDKNLALQSEIILLRVREKGLKKISARDIRLKSEKFTIDVIKKILRFILNEKKIESHRFSDQIQNYLEREDWVAFRQFEKLQTDRNIVEFEKSISSLFPELAKQWHPTKNTPLLPEHFTPGSHKKVWWLDHRGYEWQAEICYRVQRERNRINSNKNQLSFFDE